MSLWSQDELYGRAPFGFDVGSEGYLSPNDDYETALLIIDELDKDTSKRELARRAGIARPTVRRIDENREWYLSRQEAKTKQVGTQCSRRDH